MGSDYKPIMSSKTLTKSSYIPEKSGSTKADRSGYLYRGDVTYKLNQRNNAAQRHWNYGLVNDTVTTNRSQRKEKYMSEERPVRNIPPPPTAPPPPNAVSYYKPPLQNGGQKLKTTTTQTQATKTKTIGTQYESKKTKSTAIQTDNHTESITGNTVVPVPVQSKKVSTRTKGIQCSIAAKEDQVTKQARIPSPEISDKPKEDGKKSVSFQSAQPTQTTQQSSPEVTKQHTPRASQNTYRSALGQFPYPASTRSNLPPEVTACIEAYDNAHGPVKK